MRGGQLPYGDWRRLFELLERLLGRGLPRVLQLVQTFGGLEQRVACDTRQVEPGVEGSGKEGQARGV